MLVYISRLIDENTFKTNAIKSRYILMQQPLPLCALKIRRINWNLNIDEDIF